MSRKEKIVTLSLLALLGMVSVMPALRLYDLMREKLSGSVRHQKPAGNGTYRLSFLK